VCQIEITDTGLDYSPGQPDGNTADIADWTALWYPENKKVPQHSFPDGAGALSLPVHALGALCFIFSLFAYQGFLVASDSSAQPLFSYWRADTRAR